MNEELRCRRCNAKLTKDNRYPSCKSAICNQCTIKQRAETRLKWRIEFSSDLSTKYEFQCRVCNCELTDNNWSIAKKNSNNRICNNCSKLYSRRVYESRCHISKKRKRAKQSMDKNKKCALFLGVYVAEQVLSNVFNNVHRMPIHNPGYDFICNKGKKIDVKSSCINKDVRWKFKINKNQIPDFFLMIAFDNRKKLNPLYIWLIPGNAINQTSSVSISKSTIEKWSKYRICIEKVIDCCNEMRL